MTYIVRDIDSESLPDMERLAEMFNDFDTAWPGGFTRGDTQTAARVQEHMRRTRHLAVCVVEKDGEFVGFCNLEAQPGQNEIAYIGLLGARLSHHGQGVGKMLLREMIRRVTALGYAQVTLHTWAGNTKAVPLYKKTGFQWVPETDVFMRNFIPTALTIPAGRAFFAHRDWYACHVRDLAIAPDDVTWKGMKVFTYRFRDGDDFLNLTFDSNSLRLTALETPDYALSCSIAAEDAPAGETFPITWEITPRNGRTLDVALLAEGEAGLDLRVQEHLTVARETTLTRSLRVLPDARPRPRGEPGHRVRSTLLVDGQPVVLETGVKVVRPVEIQYSGQGLFPNRPQKIAVQMRSRLDRPLTGTLALDTLPGLKCEQPVQNFTLPPRSWTQCEFNVTAHEAGVFSTHLRYAAGETRGSRPVAFRAFGSSPALASEDREYDETLVLETPTIRLDTRLRGGEIALHHTPTDRSLLTQSLPDIGMPFTEERLQTPLYEGKIETTADGTAVTTFARAEAKTGLLIERTVVFVSEGLARVTCRVRNTTDLPIPAHLRLRTGMETSGFIVYPTNHGLIREPLRSWQFYPTGDQDVLGEGDAFAESWMACEEDDTVCGYIWQKGPEEKLQWRPVPQLLFDLGELAPHAQITLPPVYLFAGKGNWETVRNWWERLAQPAESAATQKQETVRVLEARLEPPTALLTDGRNQAKLTVLNRRGKLLSGPLTLHGEAFQAEPAIFALENVDRAHSFAATVQITSSNKPSAGFLDAALDTGTTTEKFRLPIVRLGSGDTLRVTETERGRFVLENGLLTLRVASDFMGSLYALERDGVNHVRSAWPEARPFVWLNPWFGGVHATLNWMGDKLLPREKEFTGETVSRTGAEGIRWEGVRTRCEVAHRDWRWLTVETEYLTTSGSNVVALVTRWINRTEARHTPFGGMVAWTQPGGTHENAVVHWEREGERRHRRSGGFNAEGISGVWSAVENARTGDFLALVCTLPDGHADFEDFGTEGPHLSARGPLKLEPNGTQEVLTWLILGSDLSQINAYAGLSQIRQLP